MTPPLPNKKQLLLIVGALILIAIICLVIAVIVMGAFSTPPQKEIPPLNITPAPPTISFINPAKGALGSIVPVTIDGTNFSYGPSPSIWLVKTGVPDIYATDVAVISPTRITCTFPLSASTVSAGQWDVFVRKSDTQYVSKIGVFTVINEVAPSLEWNWSVNGWGDWQHRASCTGATGTETRSCREYGPVIENGYGVYGSEVTLDRVPTESRVEKTFTALSGARWNTISFTGLLSPSPLPRARWMAIDVNGERVFFANATQTPPGNGQQFTITQSFPPANVVYIKISGGQDPTWGTTLYTMQFDSLTLS